MGILNFYIRKFSLTSSFPCRVVKEEISDDNAKLPCFNGRVVSWVRSLSSCVSVLAGGREGFVKVAASDFMPPYLNLSLVI